MSTSENFSYFTKVPYPNYFHPYGVMKLVERLKKIKNKEGIIDIGVGVYKDGQGKPYVFPSIRKAELRIANGKVSKNYLPFGGDPEFIKIAQKLVLGKNHPLVNSGTLASIQSLSGTGALRLAFRFCRDHLPDLEFCVPTKTWGNHRGLLKALGRKFTKFNSYDAKLLGFNIEDCLADLRKQKDGTGVIIHACGWNPTGCDPTQEEFKRIADLCKQKNFVVFLDAAYQGVVSGTYEDDRFPIKYFLSKGITCFIAQSCAKNFGLYAERVGALHITCGTKENATRVTKLLSYIARSDYSSPPQHGSNLVKVVYNDPELWKQYLGEMKGVADRLNKMRKKLHDTLVEVDTTGKDWSFITKQRGMFVLTDLTEAQCKRLVEEFKVYMPNIGRISLPGTNDDNVQRLAECIVKVL